MSNTPTKRKVYKAAWMASKRARLRTPNDKKSVLSSSDEEVSMY